MAALLAAVLLGRALAPTSAAPVGRCSLSPGRDCLDGDFHQLHTQTAEECCGQCMQTPGCAAFTHAVGPRQYRGAMCYLKLRCSLMVENSGCTAGMLSGAGAPTQQPALNFATTDKSELLHSTDCIGADIITRGGSFPGHTPQECSYRCAATPGCTAFTHKVGLGQAAWSMCYLKSDCASIIQDPSCTSGIMIGVPLGPPPQTTTGLPEPAPVGPPLVPAVPATPAAPTRAPTTTPAPSHGVATLIQTAQATGDRLTVKPSVHFQSDFVAGGPVVDVSSSDLDQEILGFGGAFTESSAVVFMAMGPDQQTQFLEKYFDAAAGLGYTIGRVPINSCDFSPAPGSWSEDDVVGDFGLMYFDSALKHDSSAMIPLIKAALVRARQSGRELKLFASPWSPPAWMKTNGKMVGGGKLRPEWAKSWADYFVKWIAAYKAHGVPIWAVTPQNEPMNPAAWEACVYSADEEAAWLGTYLGPALKAAHPEVLIFPYDHNKDAIYLWARTMYDHPTAYKFTAGISFHWYSGDSFDNLAKVHQEFPQATLLPSEATWEKHRWSPGTTPATGDWTFGEGYAHDIIGDLNAGAAGWTDWNLLLDTQGGPNHLGNFCDAAMMACAKTQQLHLHPQYYYIGHFSKYLPPGSKRIKAQVTGTKRYNGPIRQYGTCNGEDGLQATAFQRPDGKVATVVLNCGDAAISFKIKDGGRAIRATIPEHGIQTYVFERTGLYV